MQLNNKKGDTQHNGSLAELCYAECHVCLLSLMLKVSDKPFTLSDIRLDVIMLSVVMLSVVMLSVVAPKRHNQKHGLKV